MTGQWGEFTVKNATYIYIYTFLGIFVAVIVVFHQKRVFIIFISFFDKASNFRNRILTNQKPE